MHPWKIAEHTPDKPAIRLGDEVLSYGQVARRARRLARHLRACGLKRGDVIALKMGNTLDYLVICWAAQSSGLYYVPIATRLTPEETRYILADCGAGFVFTDATLEAGVIESVQALDPKSRPRMISVEASIHGTETLDGLFAEHRDYLSTADDLDDPVEGSDMLYTSGTTGHPKGVKRPLTYAPLGSEARRVDRSKALFDMDSESCFLSPAPLYHAAPLRFAMTMLRVGGEVVLMPKFDAVQALALIAERGVTHSQWVPTMFRRVLDLPETMRADFKAPRHRVAIHAGAPCPVAVKHAMINWWGPILHEYYSGTESIGFTHVTSQEWLKRPGTVGKAWNSQIHIVDDEGQERAAGEVGTVYFSGGAPLAYHNAPDKTRAAITENGWATMGDLGYVDEEGYLFLTDRKAFTIISGGVNIYPKEVEDALLALNDVRDAAVFGVPDESFGEVVMAVVEMRASPAPQSEGALCAAQQIDQALSHDLARHKCPKIYSFTNSLPRLETGKIEKKKLQLHYQSAQRDCVDLRTAAPKEKRVP